MRLHRQRDRAQFELSANVTLILVALDVHWSRFIRFSSGKFPFFRPNGWAWRDETIEKETRMQYWSSLPVCLQYWPMQCDQFFFFVHYIIIVILYRRFYFVVDRALYAHLNFEYWNVFIYVVSFYFGMHILSFNWQSSSNPLILNRNSQVCILQWPDTHINLSVVSIFGQIKFACITIGVNNHFLLSIIFSLPFVSSLSTRWPVNDENDENNRHNLVFISLWQTCPKSAFLAPEKYQQFHITVNKFQANFN